MTELKPCPFCGCEVEIVECGQNKNDGWIQIAHKVPFVRDCRVFMDCGDFFNLFDPVLLEKNTRELVEKWNRRVDK